MKKTFAGFGFGAIQGGLFLFEAFKTGRFDRLVVAEVLPEPVKRVRQNNGCYMLNVATGNGIEKHEIRGVEIYNPLVPEDRKKLVEALAEASEIATALPSVDFYNRGEASVVNLTIEAVERKLKDASLPPALFYTAENNNHAAEIFAGHFNTLISNAFAAQHRIQFLNTVVGKMSGVVTDARQIYQQGLAPIIPGADSAFLVETFNRILISRVTLQNAQRNITVFEEKNDLLPFEEAKLHGHNAIHALIGYLANEKGCRFMSDTAAFPEIIRFAQKAFIEESGTALIKKYRGLDPLFTEAGFKDYASDLLQRMLNPHLRDQVDRIIRDPKRKLAWNDRLIGTMRLALEQGIQPVCFAEAAAAAAAYLDPRTPSGKLLLELWEPTSSALLKKKLLLLIENASRQRWVYNPELPSKYRKETVNAK
jgi:mannitol-1-phosphate 5-dehydrogenase